MKTLIDPIILAEDLKEYRHKKGMTQKQLAEFLMIPLYTYRRWEKAVCRISPMMFRYLQERKVIKIVTK